MQLLKNIEAIDAALYLKKEKILIISDLHLGYEDAIVNSGVFIPRFQVQEIIQRFVRTAEKLGKLNALIINGDFKHEFGRTTRNEWIDSKKILEEFSKHCNKIIIVEGNHDIRLDTFRKGINLEIVKSMLLGKYLILHGEEIPKEVPKEVKTIIIGHEHPAVSIRDEIRTEKFKCFLVGKWKGKNLVSMPAFNPVVEGTDVQKEKLLSPFLKQDLSNFTVYVVADKIYRFGKLKNI
jgi:hypothetical protein